MGAMVDIIGEDSQQATVSMARAQTNIFQTPQSPQSFPQMFQMGPCWHP